jgi:hypothetical protein
MSALVIKRCQCGEDRWTRCGADHPWYGNTRKCRHNISRYAREILKLDHELVTKTEAEAVYRLMLTAIRNGLYVEVKHHVPPAAAPEPIEPGQTLAAVAVAYDQKKLSVDPNKTPRGKDGDRSKLTVLCNTVVNRRPFGAYPMNAIDATLLIAFRAAISDRANSTWNKYRTLLGQVFRWAKSKGYIPIDPIASANATIDYRSVLERSASSTLTIASGANLLRPRSKCGAATITAICGTSLLRSGKRARGAARCSCCNGLTSTSIADRFTFARSKSAA